MMFTINLKHFFFITLFIYGIVAEVLHLQVGESCRPMQDSSVQGTCVEIRNCTDAVQHIMKRNMHPFKRCGFKDTMEVVCCPNSSSGVTETSPGNVSRILDKQCKKIVEGNLLPFLSGLIGENYAEFGEFPHMAALGYFDEGKYTFDCGGTLISEYYILTAAYCVQLIKPDITRLGVVDIRKNDFDNETDIRISEIISHPNFTRRYKYHDLALLKLEKPVQFGPALFPACLYTGETIPSMPLVVTGWGIPTFTNFQVKYLQKAVLSLVERSECQKSYTNWRKLPHGITDEQFCAKDRLSFSDDCTIDSGGPIQAMSGKDGHYRIVGVISFGRGCASPVPGVYTRLHPYLDWIESVVWPNGL